MTHFTIKKYKGANTDVAACLTPSTYDLFAASLPFVNIAGFNFFSIGDITVSGHWFCPVSFH